MIENYGAIKFYSNRDLSIGHYLQMSEPVIQSFDNNEICSDVNRAIELYNIQQLIASGSSLLEWTEETKLQYKRICLSMNPVIGRFFASITSSNVMDCFQSLNIIYSEDFWALFSKYKVYKRVDGAIIEELLQNGAKIWDILVQKDLVLFYDEILAEYLRSSLNSAELLLDQLLSIRETHYHFPKSLQPGEYEGIFERYIESNDANPNYVKLLITSQSSGECPISPKLHQKAKRKYEADMQNRFSNQTGFEYGLEVAFLNSAEPVQIKKTNTLTPRFEYSKHWIEENLDFPTLLNNFRYLFEYADACWRITLIANKTSLSPLERAIGVKGKKEYETGVSFHFHDMLSLVQMRAYRSILAEKGINIEDLFAWFFTDYLKYEFQTEGFTFKKSSDGTSLLEKCRNIASELDGVFKQYRAFIQDGFIDRELFEMTSEHVVLSELGSFRHDKYAYANSQEIRAEMFSLFSNQSMLGYTERTQAKFNTLHDLLSSEVVKVEDFAPYQVSTIQWLITRGTLYETQEKHLVLNGFGS